MVLRSHVVERFDMRFWNDEEVNGGCGTDIVKRQDIGVLVNLFSGYYALYYLAD